LRFLHRPIWLTYLLAIFMGAMDGGIIAPAFTTILKTFQIEYKWGVWAVTVYTLMFAVSIPLVGKLADRYGRKKIFIFSVFLFALGSVFSAFSSSITQLIIARGIQAIGGGGIIPVATAEISRSFPQEKKGLALGIVGSVFTVATLISPNLGSFLIETWSWRGIFLINLPISLVILAFAARLDETVVEEKKPLDLLGTSLLSIVILGFMYGFTNLDPTNVQGSLFSPQVWPFLIMAAGWMVPFAMAQRSSKDPIIKMDYFFNRQITLILVISILTGIGLMAMIFIPSYAENMLGWKKGSGGYVVTILALAAAISSWIGGRLLDRIGGRPVIFFGFALFVAGTLMLGTVVSEIVFLSISLLFVGTGIGLTMGAPIQYVMLEKVSEEETTSALAIVQLFRSLGTTIGPTLMVAFVTRATYSIPEKIQKTLLSTFIGPGGAPGGAAPNLSQLIKDWNQIFGGMGNEPAPDFSAGTESLRDWLQGLARTPEQQRVVEELLRQIREAVHLGYQDMFLAAALIGSVGLFLSFGLSRKTAKQTSIRK
jgi:EmrB/QacA subfamily drug resistance transporter